jgi:AcrR family transcriptional regulator
MDPNEPASEWAADTGRPGPSADPGGIDRVETDPVDQPARRRRRRRAPVALSRERVLEAALRVADAEGVDAVSMRRLGQELDVEAMSLYKHVAGKDDILDGLVDLVMAEVAPPDPTQPWRPAIRHAALDLHAALLRHPWATAVMETRKTPGPTRMRYLDTTVARLREAGFDVPDVARAFMAIDSQVYGFTMQLLSFPLDFETDTDEAAAMARDVFADGYPNLVAMAEFAASGQGMPLELDFGLDFILDGLERTLDARARGRGGGPGGVPRPRRRPSTRVSGPGSPGTRTP